MKYLAKREHASSGNARKQCWNTFRVRFFGVKDLMKVTHAVLEYRFFRTRTMLESSKNVRAN